MFKRTHLLLGLTLIAVISVLPREPVASDPEINLWVLVSILEKTSVWPARYKIVESSMKWTPEISVRRPNKCLGTTKRIVPKRVEIKPPKDDEIALCTSPHNWNCTNYWYWRIYHWMELVRVAGTSGCCGSLEKRTVAKESLSPCPSKKTGSRNWEASTMKALSVLLQLKIPLISALRPENRSLRGWHHWETSGRSSPGNSIFWKKSKCLKCFGKWSVNSRENCPWHNLAASRISCNWVPPAFSNRYFQANSRVGVPDAETFANAGENRVNESRILMPDFSALPKSCRQIFRMRRFSMSLCTDQPKSRRHPVDQHTRGGFGGGCEMWAKTST